MRSNRSLWRLGKVGRMKTEDEIRKKIAEHKTFIADLDVKNDTFAGIEEDDSLTWIRALEWVLED